MKCPRCTYLVHDEPAACPNCGVTLSPGADRLGSIDLATRQAPEGPLVDLGLGAPGGTPAAAARALRQAQGVPSLSRDAAPTTALLPFPTAHTRKPTPLGQARAPLSVRRKTPDVPRLRARTARSGSAGLAINLDLEAAERPDAGAEARPESRDRAYNAASPGARFLAAAIDAVVVAAIDGAVVYFTLRLASVPAFDLAAVPLAPLALFLLLLTFGYHIGLTGAGGQTIGKMAVGIRVVRIDGTSLSWTAASLRALAALLSAAPLGLGFLAGWLRRDRATLHDRLCGTRVVKLSR